MRPSHKLLLQSGRHGFLADDIGQMMAIMVQATRKQPVLHPESMLPLQSFGSPAAPFNTGGLRKNECHGIAKAWWLGTLHQIVA
jgi:hypothetical protein